uniref:hypothetical protein n=1 Tax=Achromobacter insuavis TaxID=1287735 RepID=UPI001EEF299B
MTTHPNPNSAAQATERQTMLTADELKASNPFQWLGRRYTPEVAERLLREFESVLLSKLRAPVADERVQRAALKKARAALELTLATAQQFEKQASKGTGGRRGGPVFEKARAAIATIDAALASAHVAGQRVLVQFGDVGCAGPFPVLDGRVTLSSVTMNDLAYRMASAPADERAAFEAWALTEFTHPFMLPDPLIPDPDGSGDYVNRDVQMAWAGFQQALAALASAPVVATRGPAKERADFAIWLIRTFPSLYTSADAARFLDDGHLAALAWQAHWTADAHISTMASAPVAGEAQPVAWLHQCRKKPELAQLTMKKHEPALAAKGYRPMPLYAAPQASAEGAAAPSADAALLVGFIFDRFGKPGDAGELPDNVAAAVRRLELALKQPQAGKDAAPRTCPSGDGSLRHPCPMHPGADKDGGQQRAGDAVAAEALAHLRTIANFGGTLDQAKELAARGVWRCAALSA